MQHPCSPAVFPCPTGKCLVAEEEDYSHTSGDEKDRIRCAITVIALQEVTFMSVLSLRMTLVYDHVQYTYKEYHSHTRTHIKCEEDCL